MLPANLPSPTRFAHGPGRLNELGALAASVIPPGRILVVSDPGIVAAGHTTRAIQQLHAAGFETLLFTEFGENPTTDHVEVGCIIARDFRPQAIIAIGGGSSMDCAKGINFVHSCGGRMQDYWGVGKATADLLPMIAVPTTSGTGSEAQSFALISDAVTHVKMACGDKRAAFRLAVLDPELTVTMPPRVTALTGIDAISHALETAVTTKRTLESQQLSRQAWELMSSSYLTVLSEPNNISARSDMQAGACLAGLAIENSMLGSAHALGNPLTAQFGIPHGQAVGVMLPHVIKHNMSAELDIYRELLLVPSIDPETPRSEKFVGMGFATLITMYLQAGGLAHRLRDLNIEHDRLSELAHDASQQWTGTFNPVKMTMKDYLMLYQQAY